MTTSNIQDIITSSERNLLPIMSVPNPPASQPWGPINPVSLRLSFWAFHVARLLQSLAFCIWQDALKVYPTESVFHSVWSQIPLRCTHRSSHDLSVHELIDTWAAFTFQLLQIMLLWTFVYKFLCEHMFSIPLVILYIGVGLLDNMVTLCLIIWGAAR